MAKCSVCGRKRTALEGLINKDNDNWLLDKLSAYDTKWDYSLLHELNTREDMCRP